MDINEYYMYRDSVTGQMGKPFAIREFERLKTDKDMGAVIVEIKWVDRKSHEDAQDDVIRVSVVLAALGFGEVARLSFGKFIVFTRNCAEKARMVFSYLELAFMAGDIRFAVTAEGFSDDEGDFESFTVRFNKGLAAASNVYFKRPAIPIGGGASNADSYII